MPPAAVPPRRIALTLGVVALVAAACGGGGSTAGAGPLAPEKVITVDPASHTVRVDALGDYRGLNGEMNFDGYSFGQMTIHVPLGWAVVVHCVNESKVLRHSCAVVADQPADIGARPVAFPGASIPDPTTGLGPRQAATFRFVADRAGSYRLACVVHGHEVDGMWDRIVIAPAVRPSVSVAPAAAG